MTNSGQSVFTSLFILWDWNPFSRAAQAILLVRWQPPWLPRMKTLLVFSKCLNSAESDSKIPRTKMNFMIVGFSHQGSWLTKVFLGSNQALLPWSAFEVCSIEKNGFKDLENLTIFCPVQPECYKAKLSANLLRTSTAYPTLAVPQLLQTPLY